MAYNQINLRVLKFSAVYTCYLSAHVSYHLQDCNSTHNFLIPRPYTELERFVVFVEREKTGTTRFANKKAFFLNAPCAVVEMSGGEGKVPQRMKNANAKELIAFVPAKTNTFPDLD